MRKSLLLTAVLGALYMPSVSVAEEMAAAAPVVVTPKSAWTATGNVGFVTDYYARGVSQTFHKGALQGGFDIEHESGFSAGVWGSNVSNDTFPDAQIEVDLYANYGGDVSFVEGLGYSVGVIGYIYPGGGLDKYDLLTKSDGRDGNSAGQTKGGRFDTYEANFGLSYGYFSTKASVTLSDWFGAEKETGWTKSTKGTVYLEANMDYPLPWYDLTLVGHVGRLMVNGKLSDSNDFDQANQPGVFVSNSPNYTDYKIGLSKAFSFANSEGWNAGVYYVGARDNGYWSQRGYGGATFANGLRSDGSTAQARDLTDNRWVFSLTRAF